MASIRKRNGKWQARIRILGFDPAEKTFASRADAQAWATVTESEMLRGAYIKRTDAERTTLHDALERYEREVTPTKRSAPVELFLIRAWKAHKVARKTLSALRSTDFAKYRDERLKVVQPVTVCRELDLVSNLFTVARREWGYEGLTNVVSAIRRPTIRNARNRLFWDGEEAMLMRALEDHSATGGHRYRQGSRNIWFRPLVMLALETAMRRGELLALQWENVRLSDRVAHLPITKNGEARDVPLSSRAVELLMSLPRTIRGPVFPITANALKLGFARAIARARLMYEESGGTDARMLTDLHFHDLRHIAISRLADKLPNIIELSAVSGHRDVRMLRRYYHVKAEDLAQKLG